jgi:Peptidase family M28
VNRRVVAVAALLSLAAPAAELSARRGDEDLITQTSVRSHLEFLAGDALNGRGSGTRDEWIAAAYIAAQLRRWGIEPLGDAGGYVQQVDIERAEAAAPPTLEAGSLRLTHGQQMILQTLPAERVSGPLWKFQAGQTAPAGAVVLMTAGAAGGGPQAAQAASGAAAVLVPETPPIRARWDTLGTRLPTVVSRLRGAPAAPARPAVAVLDSASHAALTALAEGTVVTLTAPIGPIRVTHSWNAIGQLTGRDRNRRSEVILLSAHLDHLGSRPATTPSASADTIYNGADDDASGSVAVLELAEALAKGKRPRRTVMFVWFGSEEAGGWGARRFLEQPPVPLDHIVANLEFEMIGRPDPAVPPQTLWLTGYERSDLGPELARRGARLVQDPHPEQNFFMRSDNIQLARRGVIAQTVSSFGLHKEYHQPSDEVGMVDFAHMTRAIRSMLSPVRWLANAKFRPTWNEGMKP